MHPLCFFFSYLFSFFQSLGTTELNPQIPPPMLFLKGRAWGSSVGRQGESLKFLEAILESFLGFGEVFLFFAFVFVFDSGSNL